MQTGRRLAFDVGQVRTGVAVSSTDGIFSSPLGVITTPEEVAQLIAEYEPVALYVGLPLSLSGKHTASTDFAIKFAQSLTQHELPIFMVDERLTTTTAASLLRSAGKNAKQAKGSIDAAAATLILEQALNMERNGNRPGIALEDLH